MTVNDCVYFINYKITLFFINFVCYHVPFSLRKKCMCVSEMKAKKTWMGSKSLGFYWFLYSKKVTGTKFNFRIRSSDFCHITYHKHKNPCNPEDLKQHLHLPSFLVLEKHISNLPANLLILLYTICDSYYEHYPLWTQN